MEPTVMGTGVAARQASLDVAEFLAELQRAQAVVLELLASAAGRFPSAHGQLAPMCGVAARLARQLFDAQRSVLSREAEIDSLVEQVSATTFADADELRRAAKDAAREGRGATCDLGSVVRGIGADSSPGSSETVRGAIADLSAEVLRTLEDAEEMRAMLEAAFAPDEPEWRPTADALAEVLDDWWSRRGMEHEVALADASARRRLALHLARLECQEILRADGPAPAQPDLEPVNATELEGALRASVDDRDDFLDLDLEALELRWAEEPAGAPEGAFVARLDGKPLPDFRSREHEQAQVRRPLWQTRPGLAWTR